MHHLLLTIGSHGDTHPFIGLGATLKRRGHRVTLAANELFEPLVRAAGLEFVQLGTAAEYRRSLDTPDAWHPIKGFRVIFETGILPLIPATFDVIQKHYKPGQTIVTAHAIAFGARIAQEKLKLPLATIHLAPAVLRSVHLPPVFGAGAGMMQWMPAIALHGLYRLIDWAYADPVLARPINAFRAELGLPPVSRIIRDWWMSPQRVIGLFPDWFAPPQPDWPPQLKLTGFPMYDEHSVAGLSDEVSAFLAAGDPPIAFTFGSAMTQARPYLQASADACHRLGRRGILLTRHPEQLPATLPPGVKHFDYAPFSELLPRCAALVHHGGIGTSAQALAAGIPQLVMPMSADQHDNAARIQRLGTGASLSPGRYREKTVASKLNRLLADPALLPRCRQVAERFIGPNPLEATCDLIEQLAYSSPGMNIAL